jgi:SHS2 domain-containing protein
MAYRFIDHTADIGIRVVSRDLKMLFVDAAHALIDIMGAWCAQGSGSESIALKGIDREDILVRWLQELLFLIEVKNLRISHVDVFRIGRTDMEAVVTGSYTPKGLKQEIKAVTYHNLEIQEVDNHVEVTIIFDT